MKQKPKLDIDPTSSNIQKLIAVALLSKFSLIIVTIFLFKSFIDSFAIMYYYSEVTGIFEGQIPYVNSHFAYPILSMIPILLAAIPALLLNSPFIYLMAFMMLMVCCDCVTLYCIYKIALKVWGTHRQAFIAGLLYTMCFSVAYFTMTEYVAFSTMLLMFSITVTIYKEKEIKGYLGIVAGFFSKIYPAVALPFIVLYNSKETSLKTELLRITEVFGIAGMILFVPAYLINKANLDTYLFKINGVDREMYASGVSYMVYSWLHDVFSISTITVSLLSIAGKCIILFVVLVLLYAAYKSKKQDPHQLIKQTLCALFIVVTFMLFHSPNYDTWYVPLICILAVNDIRKIVLLILSQIIGYIVFPLSFYTLWGNPSYTAPIGTPSWQITLMLFTIQFIVLFALVWLCVEPRNIYKEVTNG